MVTPSAGTAAKAGWVAEAPGGAAGAAGGDPGRARGGGTSPAGRRLPVAGAGLVGRTSRADTDQYGSPVRSRNRTNRLRLFPMSLAVSSADTLVISPAAVNVPLAGVMAVQVVGRPVAALA